MMFILLGAGEALLLSAVQLWKIVKKRTRFGQMMLVAQNILLVVLLSLALFRYVFHRHFLLSKNTIAEYGLFAVIAAVVSLGLLLCSVLAGRFLSTNPKGSLYIGRKILAAVLVFAGVLCIVMTNWGKAEYGDLPIDQGLITFLSPTTGSGQGDFLAVYEGPLVLVLLAVTVFASLVFPLFSHGSIYRIAGLTAAAALFLGGAVYAVHQFRLLDLYTAYLQESTIIDDNYVDPRTAHIQFPEKKRNLIHIYLESMENSYMSKDMGGFMDENLIPELTELAGEGYNFSHLPEGPGGPQSAVGTTWSVASMVNMSTGLPMKLPTDHNAYHREDSFLPGAWTLGDILAQQGYEQTLMFGADADFGGLSTYFQTHGNFNIKDYQYARKTGLIPEDYFVWWGFEDDKLFDFAKDELTRLSQTGKPFHFVMENADTHRPDGYLSPHADTPYPNQYANVVAYSSAQVAEFVRWIQKQPFYDNTTVVIIGDHLSMESNFFKFYDFDKDYHRSQYHVILNPAPGTVPKSDKVFHNRTYANFDMFPTILSSLGATYDGQRLGIGTNLFSGEKTLFEEYGFKKADHELAKKSQLYNEKIFQTP